MANLRDIFNAGGIKLPEVVGEKGFYTKEQEIYESDKLQKKFISSVDYSDPANFAKFGSAEEYYKSAINYINSEYPYDGSSTEKLKWTNSLNELEYYIFKNEYPRNLGSVDLSSSQTIEVYSRSKNISDDIRTLYNEGDKFKYNTYIDFEKGITFESWIKLASTSATDILTISAYSSSDGIDYEPVDVLQISASGGYFGVTDTYNTYTLSQSVPVDEWHHYAFRINTGSLQLFVDGQMSVDIPVEINQLRKKHVFTPFGLFILKLNREEIPPTSYENTPAFILGGGGNLALDETRFWNGPRSIEKLGRFWFTNVDGNDKVTISDADPTEPSLIFYFRYNEGWNSDRELNIIDSSGRTNHGVVTSPEDYEFRSSISAINASGFVQDIEVGEPIIQGVPLDTYNWSDTLHDYYLAKLASGKEYDATNEHQLYNKFPSWLLEAEEENDTKHLKQMIQIVSVYFDDLYNKIGEISQYKHQKLESDSDKIYPFYDKILTSTGFDVTDLFTNLDIVEKVSSRDDLNLFDESVEKVKNKIYQNIYNNLSYILKAKGTEKSLKSLLRAYGVGDNLVKVNLYGDRDVYNVGDRSEEKIVKKKTLDLGLSSSKIEVVEIPAGSISGSFTYEAQFILPKRVDALQTCSLMGINGTNKVSINILTDATGSTFSLVTGSQQVTSSKFVDLYNNGIWNIALRGSPDIPTITNNAVQNYNMDFIGYSFDTDANRREFSGSIKLPASAATTFLESAKTLYVGKDTQDTNVKVLDIGYWSAYLEDDVIAIHTKDITNYGTSDIVENIENRVFYADLEDVSGSDSNGQFAVHDLFNNYAGLGSDFAASSTDFIKKEDLKTYKTLNFDTLQGIETIQTLEEDDETTRSLRKKPTSIQLLVENSMYQIISEEMINMFATIGEYMFAFAEGGNRYRDTYSRLGFLRGKFFDKIVSNPDIEKYLEFYKWIDSALGHMIDQLKPETANSISGLKNTIESHMLERNKFEHKLPLTVGVNPSNVYGNGVRSIGPIVTIGSSIKPDADVLFGKTYRGMLSKKDISSREEYLPVVSIENIENKNYVKSYEVVQGAGKAINHRNGKTGDVIFKTNFSAGDSLAELNRDTSVSDEYSIYNSLLNKNKGVRDELNYSSSLSSSIQGTASVDNFADNNFVQRNIPYTASNYTNTETIPYQAFPSAYPLYLRNNNILEVGDRFFREPPVEWNVAMFHDIKMPSAFENMEVLSPYSSKLNKFVNSDIVLFVTGAAESSDGDTFYRKIDNLPTSSVQINRVEHLEYVFPKRTLMGMRESRTKPLYPEASGTFNPSTRDWSIDSYNRVSSGIRSFWRDDGRNRRRTRGADHSSLTGSINVLNSYNLSSNQNFTINLAARAAGTRAVAFAAYNLYGLSIGDTINVPQTITSSASEIICSAGNKIITGIVEISGMTAIGLNDDPASTIYPSTIATTDPYTIGIIGGNRLNVIVDKTGSVAQDKYNFSGSYYLNLRVIGVSNRYDSIYSMDSSGSIIYSGSN